MPQIPRTAEHRDSYADGLLRYSNLFSLLHNHSKELLYTSPRKIRTHDPAITGTTVALYPFELSSQLCVEPSNHMHGGVVYVFEVHNIFK